MPSKTIEDFAYQVRDYMRSAEVVPSKNVWKVRDDISSDISANVTYTISRTNGLVDYIDIDGTANARSAFNATVKDMNFTLPAGEYRLENLPAGIAGINVQAWNGSSEVAVGTFNSSLKTITVTSEQASMPLRIEIVVANGTAMNHVKLYPMITISSETDQTYMPYFEPLKDSKLSIKDQQVLGAWNLLENKATTQTINPVTFTVNADKSVSLSGTTGASDYKSLVLTDTMYLEAGKPYYLSGCPVDGGHTGAWRYTLQVVKTNNVEPTYLYGHGFDNGKGSGAFAVAESGYYRVRINSYSNQTYSGQTFYPMIALKPNLPYVSYAMTNRELTDKLAIQESAFTDIISGASVTDNMNYLTKTGNVVSAWLILGSVTVASWTKIAGIPDGYRPKHDMYLRDAQSNKQFKISTAGNLSCADALSSASFAICFSWITP